MEIQRNTLYKCKFCGRAIERFVELGKYAAACSNGACRGCYDYPAFDSLELLESWLRTEYGEIG